jgi:hypothetical protein
MESQKPAAPGMPHTQTSAPVEDAPAQEVRPDLQREARQEQGEREVRRDDDSEVIPNFGEDPGV